MPFRVIFVINVICPNGNRKVALALACNKRIATFDLLRACNRYDYITVTETVNKFLIEISIVIRYSDF